MNILITDPAENKGKQHQIVQTTLIKSKFYKVVDCKTFIGILFS